MKKIFMLLCVFLLVGVVSVSAAFPASTNDINIANNWAHVNEVSKDVGEVTLDFVNPRAFFSCFEYRTDGDISQASATPHYNPEVGDALYPFLCTNDETVQQTFYANEYVEVRLTFGAEGDERFDWTRFDVGEKEPIFTTPDNPSVALGGSAQIIGSGDPPVVEHMWILPDEDSEVSETQLMVAPGEERTDIYACMVASDLQGRDSLRKAFVKVYHPDGSFKYQAHATQLDLVDDEQEIRDCVADAVEAGLITWEEAYNEAPFDGILYNIFKQPNWYMYKVYLPMYYHQPSGMYNVKGWVTDASSGISEPYARMFEWVPGTYLALDFDTVNFGSIEALSWKVANGDDDFQTPEYPTLKNNGNTEIAVGVEFSDFVGFEFGKVIDDFDAQLRSDGKANDYNDIVGEHFEFPSNVVQDFTWPIELCRQEKIDFSIHADSGVVPDAYSGSITVYATGVDEYGVGMPPVDETGTVIEFDGFHAENPTE